MRRLFVVITAIVTLGVSCSENGRASAREAGASELEQEAQQNLPPLPADIQGAEEVEHRREVRPTPFGYPGFKPERWLRRRDRSLVFSFAFGKSNRVNWTCVSSDRGRR